MQLFQKQYSEAGEPLIILHGLFGNHANWSPHAGALADKYRVHAFDMRNHGASPWGDSHTYADLAGDLIDTLDALDLPRVHVIGHSMGGKAAMQLAFRAPERIARLILVDIAPVTYPDERFAPLEGMSAIDTGTLRSRAEADRILAGHVDSKPVRDFLLTNLQRVDGGYAWRCNLEVIAEFYSSIRGRPEPMGRFEGPTLVIRGGESDYVLNEYERPIRNAFPAARVETVPGTGHWVHSEKPAEVLALVRDFLAE